MTNPEARIRRRLAAVLIADVVGFSALVGADEEGTLTALKAIRADIVDREVVRCEGRVVKSTGDGVLVEFASAINALTCALAIQQGMAVRNSEPHETRPIMLRIGINVGDIVIDGDDIMGDGVNVAARLEAMADPGGVVISRAVHEQVQGRGDVVFEDLGEQSLKNIARPVRAFRAGLATTAQPPVNRVSLALPDRPSIAVLPFENMGGEAAKAYFADGIAEDIITGLSQLRWLFVIARNSSFTYLGRHVDVRQVGRELGVRYVLEGSVRWVGNRVRVTAQLIEAATGTHIWAERYDRQPDDVFAIQDEITSSVIGCIQPELLSAEHGRVTLTPPQNLDAWENFVRAMFLYSQHTDASTREALGFLDNAITLDAKYARAHGLMALCLGWRAFQGWEDRPTAFARGMIAVDRAIACDARDPWAYVAQGMIISADRDNAAAIAAVERAIAVSPNFAFAHALLGCMHAMGGRPEQGIAAIDIGVRLSPRDTFADEYFLYYAFAHFQAGRYAMAAAEAQRAIQLRPGHPVLYVMAGASFGLSGQVAQAQAMIAKVRELVPTMRARDMEEHFSYCLADDRRRLAEGLVLGGMPYG